MIADHDSETGTGKTRSRESSEEWAGHSVSGVRRSGGRIRFERIGLQVTSRTAVKQTFASQLHLFNVNASLTLQEVRD